MPKFIRTYHEPWTPTMVVCRIYYLSKRRMKDSSIFRIQSSHIQAGCASYMEILHIMSSSKSVMKYQTLCEFKKAPKITPFWRSYFYCATVQIIDYNTKDWSFLLRTLQPFFVVKLWSPMIIYKCTGTSHGKFLRKNLHFAQNVYFLLL